MIWINNLWEYKPFIHILIWHLNVLNSIDWNESVNILFAIETNLYFCQMSVRIFKYKLSALQKQQIVLSCQLKDCVTLSNDISIHLN